VSAARFDLERITLRDLNDFLHHGLAAQASSKVEILNSRAMHDIAVSVDWPGENNIRRHAGYFNAAELCADNQELTRNVLPVHELCDKHNDVATGSMIENWIDETERRTCFLSEIVSKR
jgi:hypothetical protein